MSDLSSAGNKRLKNLYRDLSAQGFDVDLSLTPHGIIVTGKPADMYMAKIELRKRGVKLVEKGANVS